MLIIGHRGARGLAPENTLAALDAGIKAHADMIEIDVRVTSDKKVVLSHDPYILDSVCKKIFIADTAFNDLQSIKKDMFALEAALQFINRRVKVIIEVKPAVDIEPIVACMEHCLSSGWLESDIILSSFDFKLLQKLHEIFPKIPIAILEKWSGVRAGHRARKLGTKLINMNERWLWSGFVSSVTKRGYKLSAYTLNNVKKAHRLEKHGLYGCITDFPDRFTVTN
jgi:glycerophosphoryl diester phosphodiesterase